MAIKVKKSELKNPVLIEYKYTTDPFTKKEIEELVKNLKKFATTSDGEYVYIWSE